MAVTNYQLELKVYINEFLIIKPTAYPWILYFLYWCSREMNFTCVLIQLDSRDPMFLCASDLDVHICDWVTHLLVRCPSLWGGWGRSWRCLLERWRSGSMWWSCSNSALRSGLQGVGKSTLLWPCLHTDHFLTWGGRRALERSHHPTQTHHLWSNVPFFRSLLLGLLVKEIVCKNASLAKHHEDVYETVFTAITFFICGAFGVRKSVQVTGRGHRAAKLRHLAVGARDVRSKLLCRGFLFGQENYLEHKYVTL